jgi:hypothetical protein
MCSGSSYTPEAYSYRCTSWISPFPTALCGLLSVAGEAKWAKRKAEVIGLCLKKAPPPGDALIGLFS